MANKNSGQGTGTAADTAAAAGTSNGEAAQTKTRESRNNHAAAEAVTITSAATAQNYIDRVQRDTANDKVQSMFNSSGFTTPAILARQSPENLLRMSVCISAALASQVASDGEAGEQAAKALTIVGEYSSQAGKLQLETRNRAKLAAAAEVLGLPANATAAQIKAAMASQS